MAKSIRTEKALPKPAGSDGVTFREKVRRASREFESALILEALQKNRWNRRRTAEALEISYRLLMYKMKNCDLRTEGRDAEN